MLIQTVPARPAYDRQTPRSPALGRARFVLPALILNRTQCLAPVRPGAPRRCPLSQRMQKKNLTHPDQRREFPQGHIETVALNGVTFGRARLQPGWRWSEALKPIVKTDSCQATHLQYHVSGRLHVVMDDGAEDEFVAGDVSFLPPGHDAWVVGDEPVDVIDISGLADYASPR